MVKEGEVCPLNRDFFHHVSPLLSPIGGERSLGLLYGKYYYFSLLSPIHPYILAQWFFVPVCARGGGVKEVGERSRNTVAPTLAGVAHVGPCRPRNLRLACWANA